MAWPQHGVLQQEVFPTGCQAWRVLLTEVKGITTATQPKAVTSKLKSPPLVASCVVWCCVVESVLDDRRAQGSACFQGAEQVHTCDRARDWVGASMFFLRTDMHTA
jgi:hypothetical protein